MPRLGSTGLLLGLKSAGTRKSAAGTGHLAIRVSVCREPDCVHGATDACRNSRKGAFSADQIDIHNL